MFSYQMFNYAATATDVAESEVRRLEEVSRVLEGSMGSNFSAFFATGGYALVDPGAAMEVCGERTFQEERRLLKELGIQPVEVHGSSSRPVSGVGGEATTLGHWLVPIFIGPGWVNFGRRTVFL